MTDSDRAAEESASTEEGIRAGNDSPTAKTNPRTTDESPVRTVFVAIALAIVGMGVPIAVLLPLSILVFALDPPGASIMFGGLAVLQFVLFVVVGIGYLRWRGFEWTDVREYFGISLPSLRDIGLILVTWIVMLVVAMVVAVVVTTIVPELLGTEEGTEPAENPVAVAIAENPEWILIGIVGMFLVVGPAEEILFRGVIQNRLRERLSAIPAIIIASAIFAIVHVAALAGQDPVAIAMSLTILFVPGLGLGVIYEYTGNIVVPSLLHGFHNSVLLVLVYATAVAEAGMISGIVALVAFL